LTLKLSFKIVWGDKKYTYNEKPLYPGIDGIIEYYFNDGDFPFVFQPFKQGNHYILNGRNAWGWDGNKDEPTLMPSIVIDQSPRFRAHLYFKKGKIELLSDSFNIEI